METKETQSRIDSLMAEYEKYYAELEKNDSHTDDPEPLKYSNVSSVSELMLKMQYENQQLIRKGGIVKRKDDPQISCWEFMPKYMYVILAISSIAMIFFAFLQSERYIYIFDFTIKYLKKDVYIGLWFIYIGYLLFFIAYLMIPILENRDFNVLPANSKAPVVLGLGNFMGFSLIGDYRSIGDTVVAYYCLCIFIPLIPLGCYRVSRGKTEWKLSQGYRTPYRIYGSEKWDWLEVIVLYINSIAGLLIALGCINIIF